MADRQRPLGLIDPKVVTKWDKDHLAARSLPIDYVLFSNYKSPVEAHLEGALDLAWNSPLRWYRDDEANGREVWPLVMRDTDQACTSRIVVRADDAAVDLDDLRDRRVGVGAVDPPQADVRRPRASDAMNLIAIAKAPVAGVSKTRLCPPCTPEQAATVAEAALADTLDVLASAAEEIGGRAVLALDGAVGAWLPPGLECDSEATVSMNDWHTRSMTQVLPDCSSAWTRHRSPRRSPSSRRST